MLKKITAYIVCTALALSMCGCGSVFDKTYIAVDDYVPQVQDTSDTDGKITVRSFAGLKQAILKLVTDGTTNGTIVFDPAYDGDTAEDMDSACWQVKTRDALCAYCVVDINYELRKIVTYDEAYVTITFTPASRTAGSIEKVAYSTGADELIRKALQESRTKLVILVGNSAYSAVDMESLVQSVYRAHPATSPTEPKATVRMYSGSGSQRLYEIKLNYMLSSETLKNRKDELSEINAFKGVDIEALSELDKAQMARDYLVSNCDLTEEGDAATVYASLVERCADSEGIALGYVELCTQIGVDCQIVYGQHNWNDHYWNIVKIDGDYYHVDVSGTIGGTQIAFLNSDAMMWEMYRWDTASYPTCEGELTKPIEQ